MSINHKNILLSSSKYLTHKEYWVKILEDYNNQNYFKSYKESNLNVINMNTKKFVIHSAIKEQLLFSSKNKDMSLFLILLTGLHITMYKYSDIDSIITAIPCVVNTEIGNNYLPIKYKVSKDKLFKECVLEVSNVVKDAYSHSMYSLEGVFHEENYPAITCQYKGLKVFQNENMKLSQINFIFYKESNQLNCDIVYNTNVFDQGIIDYIFNYYCNVLECFVLKSDIKILDVKLLKENDEKKLLKDFNHFEFEYQYDTIIKYLDYNFKQYPYQIVVKDSKSELNFKNLYEKSNQLIHFFQEQNIKKGERIAILLERSVEYIIALVATIRAGCTYIPLDDNMPIDRINYMLEDSNARFLILSTRYDKSQFNKNTLCIYENDYTNYPKTLKMTRNPNICNKDIAYIIYTSGTTGFPKGVMINHEGVVNLVLGMKEKLFRHLTKDSCYGMLSSFCFDASIKGIFAALILGVKLYLISKEVRLDKNKLIEVIHKEKIDILDGTPMDLKLMLHSEKSDLSCLKSLFIGGEALPKDVVKHFFNKFNGDYQICNVYGPTETVVDASYLHIDCGNIDKYDEILSIGYTFPNKKIYILGKNKELLPIGSVGELYISGIGVMNGYMNKDDLTSKCLFKDPYNSQFVMYKTGDFGYWNSDGTIGYLGRKDSQIKIDGYRIELSEIEALLNKNPQILEAVVLVDNDKNDMLSCYYISDKILEESYIIDYMKDYVPTYMIPKKIIQVSEIPYNVNGKIERKKLMGMKQLTGNKNIVMPRDESEKEILEQLKIILENDNIGIEDNFFQVGGNSLKALQLIHLLKNIGYDITMLDIFTNQTVRNLYDNIRQKKSVLVSDKKEAEKILKKEFDSRFSFVLDSYNDKEYIFLKYENENINLDTLNEYMLDHFDDTIIPNYIISEEKWDTVIKKLRENELISTDLCNQYYREFIEKWKTFENNIKNFPIEETYPISAIQKALIHIKASNSGTNLIFNQQIDIKKFQKAFQLVLKKHTLLRSEFMIKDKEYYCKQFEINHYVSDIPVIDLSNLSWNCQEQIITKLLNLIYYSEVKILHHLLYKAVLIKKNNKEYILSIPSHHCIFDGMSGQVLKKTILDFYHNDEDTTVLSYQDYINTIDNEMSNIDQEQIIHKYNLDIYTKFFNHMEYQQVPLNSIKFELERDHIKEKWEFSLDMFQKILFEIFQVEQIPIYILSYGRRYMVKNFFDYFGAFIDLVPCIFNKKDSISELTDRVKQNIIDASNQNINFISAILNNYDKKKISIDRLQLHKQPMLIFNYQGNTDIDNYELRNSLNATETKEMSQDLPAFHGIYFEVLHTNNRFRFSIESTLLNIELEQIIKKICQKTS